MGNDQLLKLKQEIDAELSSRDTSKEDIERLANKF